MLRRQGYRTLQGGRDKCVRSNGGMVVSLGKQLSQINLLQMHFVRHEFHAYSSEVYIIIIIIII